MRALCSLLLLFGALTVAPTLASAACLGDGGPNGIVEAGEACDDGDNVQNNGCTNQCTLAQGYQCVVPTVMLTPEQQSALVCAVNTNAAWTASPLGGEQTANSVPTIAATDERWPATCPARSTVPMRTTSGPMAACTRPSGCVASSCRSRMAAGRAGSP